MNSDVEIFQIMDIETNWGRDPRFGLKFRANESPSRFLSIANPPDPQILPQISKIPVSGQTSKSGYQGGRRQWASFKGCCSNGRKTHG